MKIKKPSLLACVVGITLGMIMISLGKNINRDYLNFLIKIDIILMVLWIIIE